MNKIVDNNNLSKCSIDYYLIKKIQINSILTLSHILVPSEYYEILQFFLEIFIRVPDEYR